MLQFSESLKNEIKAEKWDDLTSNRDQQYLTHGLFRYFGKLPPSITGRILDEVAVPAGGVVVDLMCGSGTTLIEAGSRGLSAIGNDCNYLSVAVAKAKTQVGAIETLEALAREYEQLIKHQPSAARANWRPVTRNIDHWFAPDAQERLSYLREWLLPWFATPAGPAAMACFASCVRPASNASVRIGRLFRETDKVWTDPLTEFPKRLAKAIEGLKTLRATGWRDDRIAVLTGDGRATQLGGSSADVVWMHPPYFALYKYSSDVLRLELDWLGLDRKSIVKSEIVDGFKTTDAGLVAAHIADLRDMAAEAYRIAKPSGTLVIVTADSTLREALLHIIPQLIEQVESIGWSLARRAERNVRFAQASYHRSANAKIQRPTDEVLLFRK